VSGACGLTRRREGHEEGSLGNGGWFYVWYREWLGCLVSGVIGVFGIGNGWGVWYREWLGCLVSGMIGVFGIGNDWSVGASFKNIPNRTVDLCT
jgi:hypothetical protein